MAKIPQMPKDYRISARTPRVVWDAMVDVVRDFADEKRVLFRNRKLGNEAFVNAAVWHFAELPRSEQEAILLDRLPKLERHLSADDSPALAPRDGAITLALPRPHDADSHPPQRDVETGAPLSTKGKGRREGSI